MQPKTLGRKGAPAAEVVAKQAKQVRPEKKDLPNRSNREPASRQVKIVLGEAERDLVERLAERTGLLPREILERALSAYAMAVVPGLPLASAKEAAPQQRLFLSIDGKPELEVGQKGVFLGRDPGCEVVLDLPLISPRHARVIAREGRWIFEDLRSARGTWRQGEKFEVRFIEDGDEYDLGGFLPVRARLA